jgi:large subunit ribosomal protein L35
VAWAGGDVAHAICFVFGKFTAFAAIKGDQHMPKIKTNRSAAKRFKKTGTGKIVYHKSFGSHILSTKSRKRKRSLRKSPIVDKSNMKMIKLMLPNG